ncbi:DUF1292 domain-containing protein [Anaerococcus hydrogenalis]|nr:DUF1292 domain-containing protein [Anaerococcus hydrogenalis]EGC84259.1 hypothetical protein HMPREF9246_0643 [Anaerococcus hydrogenalis ACS-025-V-Sch4]MDK7694539.1 DUF1292 domain-containing protein [Anaerococcus hydrogenalis]MDK7696317.1 DUF1292 domain-containing protein [Anaerococcus hydrogenalis]MDK7707566.1 DUF1292 domain-containing protein [Anaerococcus hydrogenalis]
MDKIILTDDNNKEVEFNIIDTFGVDDKDYAALEPIDEDFILILEMIKDKDSISFKAISNDREFDEIAKIYEDMKEDKNEH